MIRWARQRPSSVMPGLCQSSRTALMRSGVISGAAVASMGARYGDRGGVQGESVACTRSCAQMRYMRGRFLNAEWCGGELGSGVSHQPSAIRGKRSNEKVAQGSKGLLCVRAWVPCAGWREGMGGLVRAVQRAPPGRWWFGRLLSTGGAALRPWRLQDAPPGRGWQRLGRALWRMSGTVGVPDDGAGWSRACGRARWLKPAARWSIRGGGWVRFRLWA